MNETTLTHTIQSAIAAAPGQIIQQNYYYHDTRIICYTNQPILFSVLDNILHMFSEPAVIRGEATYALFCDERGAQFPLQLPNDRVSTGTLSLPKHTLLKYYRSQDHTTDYLHFTTHLPANKQALSIIHKGQYSALTQLGLPELHDLTFLHRYIVLITLGELLQAFGFEPCHAAAITVPWSNQQGALILGTSGSGKTTLSLGCICQGFGLVSDDLVMLRQETPNEPVNAYALLPDISVRTGTLDLWPQLSFLRTYPMDTRDKRNCMIEEIHSGATRLHTQVRILLFPSLTTAQTSTIIPLSKIATLQALIHYCISKENMPLITQERLFALLTSLAEQTQGYQLVIASGDTAMPQRLCTLFSGAQA